MTSFVLYTAQRPSMSSASVCAGIPAISNQVEWLLRVMAQGAEVLEDTEDTERKRAFPGQAGHRI